VAPAAAQASRVFEFAGGRALVEWISPSSFRFCRAQNEARCQARPVSGAEETAVSRGETASHVRLETEYLSVEINKKDLRLRVLDSRDKELMAETSPAVCESGDCRVERVAAPGERFYGLGARADARLNARGQTLATTRGFLISSRGYGLHHIPPGTYLFDLAASQTDRYRIVLRQSAWFEYYFYFGPGPKAVLEEHRRVVPSYGYRQFGLLQPSEVPRLAASLPEVEEASWASLEGAIRALNHLSMSGIVTVAFDLGRYASGPDVLYGRAAQAAAVMPLLYDSSTVALTEDKLKIREQALRWRARLVPFFSAYAEEAATRGLPLIHPLAMQFPADAEGADISDQFMVGDEILAAPLYGVSSGRSLYLPMGFWTDLWTGKQYSGRRRIEIEAAHGRLPMFVKNGSIVPLAGEQAGAPMEAHYFPTLPAEFFIYEDDTLEYTQLHAAPAADVLRLEIESRADRGYEWVVHHAPPPREIRTNGILSSPAEPKGLLTPGAWRYDADRQTIRIRVDALRDKRVVTHVSY